MTDTGATSPGTMADDNAVGTITWQNPDNAKVSDNTYTYASTTSYPLYSHYLKATNFGFTIPEGATIVGIKVEIERKADVNSGDDYVIDNAVKIVKSDGSIGTTDKKSATKWSTSEAYFTYGADNDLWGETWEYTDINDADFGVVLQLYLSIGGGP